MRTHTPGYLIALLTVHASSDPINASLKDDLIRDGMIEHASTGYWRTTSKGAAFVDLLCDVPVPVQKWVDPRVAP